MNKAQIILDNLKSEEELEKREFAQTNRIVSLDFALRKAETGGNIMGSEAVNIVEDAKIFYEYLNSEND